MELIVHQYPLNKEGSVQYALYALRHKVCSESASVWATSVGESKLVSPGREATFQTPPCTHCSGYTVDSERAASTKLQ